MHFIRYIILPVIICIVSITTVHAQEYVMLDKKDIIIDGKEDVSIIRILKADSSHLAAGFYQTQLDKHASFIRFQVDSSGQLTGKLLGRAFGGMPDSFCYMMQKSITSESYLYFNKQLQSYVQFQDGRICFSKEYTNTGWLYLETQYDQYSKPLFRRRYTSNNRLEAETFYYAGGRNEFTKAYYPSGKLKSIDSSEIQKFVSFYEDGRLKDYQIDSGNTRISRSYYMDGSLISEEWLYAVTDVDGTWKKQTEYYDNGKIKKALTSTRLYETIATYDHSGILVERKTTPVPQPAELVEPNVEAPVEPKQSSH